MRRLSVRKWATNIHDTALWIENCKLCGVDPYAYLAEVLGKIVNGHPNSAIGDLLPWAYAIPEPLKAVA
jgi:transposase